MRRTVIISEKKTSRNGHLETKISADFFMANEGEGRQKGQH